MRRIIPVILLVEGNLKEAFFTLITRDILDSSFYL
jgi:hypothetical protein